MVEKDEQRMIREEYELSKKTDTDEEKEENNSGHISSFYFCAYSFLFLLRFFLLPF